MRAACQNAHPIQRHYDELLAPTTAGALQPLDGPFRAPGAYGRRMATGVEGGSWG